MQIIDTFSGIGGFSLAGSWIGWRTIQFCEIDKFCQKVLKYHWPDVPLHEDIKTLTSEIIKSSPLYEESESTIFVGGVPCQPWSLAGKRKGKADDRNLWPQTVKLIGAIHPDWAVLENVFGLTNWNGGVVFREVLSDLEYEGYEVQPFIIPACAVNAPHRRDRVWIVVHSKHEGIGGRDGKQKRSSNRNWTPCQNGDAADTMQPGYKVRLRPGWGSLYNQAGQSQGREFTRNNTKKNWSEFPTESPLRSRNDGVPGELDGITVSKLRNESIKCYGNAIVPQVAFEIFKAIERYSVE